MTFNRVMNLACYIILTDILLSISITKAFAQEDRVISDAELSHVVVMGYSKETWITPKENTWFYSGAVIQVKADTMLVATILYSSGVNDLDQQFLGSSPEEYSLFINFGSGIILPASHMAMDSRLLYLKLYIGDILTYGYDYTILNSATEVEQGNLVSISYFCPGQGRKRISLQITNESANSDPDQWNWEKEYILARYPFDEFNSGSPVIYYNIDTTLCYLQGLLNIRSISDVSDNVVFQIPPFDYIDQLAWKDVNRMRIPEIRDYEYLPL
jgi:hypothetical protein